MTQSGIETVTFRPPKNSNNGSSAQRKNLYGKGYFN